MSRIVVTLLTAALVLGTAATGASAAPRCAATHHAHGARTCKPQHRKKRPAKVAPATPVGVALLDGSVATLDLGGGVVRTTALTGTLKGSIAGGYRLGRDNTVTLKTGTLAAAPTDLLTDDCTAGPPARTNPATTITLAPGRPIQALVKSTGEVVSTAAVILRSVLDVRSGACGSAAVPTGYADTPLTVALHGLIQRGTGLSALTLDSDPAPVNVRACLAPGAPAAPCTGTPVGYPVTLSTHLVVKVSIG
jgi:hypothetical protein